MCAIGIDVRGPSSPTTSKRELAFLGIASSPAFVRQPEGNGCVERFIHTLKENLLWVRRFETIEELRLALHASGATYNQTWIVERGESGAACAAPGRRMKGQCGVSQLWTATNPIKSL